MNLDQDGLPIQSDGDNRDQLQRVGMIVTAGELQGLNGAIDTVFLMSFAHLFAIGRDCLQISPGLFVRFIGGNPNNVSADQLISAIAAHVVSPLDRPQLLAIFGRMVKRLGFAQNTIDGLNDNAGQKLPDFLFFRAMPLFVRASWLTWILAWVFDWYLIVLVIGDWIYFKTEPDPVDINNTLLTLAVCRLRKPTLISCLAAWAWPRLRPEIMPALRRYHRAETGGNPEIADRWAKSAKLAFGVSE